MENSFQFNEGIRRMKNQTRDGKSSENVKRISTENRDEDSREKKTEEEELYYSETV